MDVGRRGTVYRYRYDATIFSNKTPAEIARMTEFQDSMEISDPTEIAALHSNPYLSRYLRRHGSKALYGGCPLGCNYRYFYRGWSKLASLEKAREGCQKKIDQRKCFMQNKIKILCTGGTIDKVYFDALSEFKIGNPQISPILQEANAILNYEVVSLLKKDSLEISPTVRLQPLIAT